MTQHPEKLRSNQFYHIYNHGLANRDLFITNDNYEYFLNLYDKYISPIAETYAWVLMKNHLHLLVKIKASVVYKYSIADKPKDAIWFKEHKWETVTLTDLSACTASDSVNKVPKPHLHFSHLFNAYAKYLNQFEGVSGTLFQRPFKRKPIDNIHYLRKVILYIHNNPVHHGFCDFAMDYPWSSYLTCTSTKATRLLRTEVLDWFGDVKKFKTAHHKKLDFDDLDKWLEE